jgi:excinuclease ABC subunit A
VLVEGWRRFRGDPGAEPGRCTSIDGFEHLSGLELIDQRPIGRSSRSNAVSFVKAWDDLRTLLAATPEAQAAGLSAGSFSFNQDRGRCPSCKGTGTVEIDLAFMAPVVVECDACRGRKFTATVLRARLDGLDVAEILELTVDQAVELFGDGRKRLARRLGALQQVGLGYLALGQSTDTLSAGEAQRLKLASFLLEPAGKGRRLYVFDEPTTGLHLTDIALLYRTLRGLIRLGHGVVVVEHQLDLVARADWIVDLGPEGGPGGGQLLFSGPIENFVEKARSPTAEALREVLGEAALA